MHVRNGGISFLLGFLILVNITQSHAQRFDDDAQFPGEGRFYQVHYLRMGMEHGNPTYGGNSKWFRVNSPNVSLMEKIKNRYETRYNGLMMIWAEADITSISSAELYLEVWGGHPGTFNKRVSVNGRSTYELPEVGSAERHCTHSYPTINLKRSDLVNGYNAFQFACERAEGWGHYIIHDAHLRMELSPDHSILKAAGLEGFEADVEAHLSDTTPENCQLTLKTPQSYSAMIESVDYQAFYTGYDENGNGLIRDWHGLTHRNKQIGFAGQSMEMPFNADWDISMLPEQSGMAVRAVVQFKDRPDLIYLTSPVSELQTSERKEYRVEIHSPEQIPVPFWSRANRKMTCVIELESAEIERAILHIAVWGGNAGTVTKYFTLNGHFFPIAPPKGEGPIWYHQIDVPAALLKPGSNTIELLSDTEHHGIEVLRPGPALTVRYRL
jgi:hypothetical protein